MFVRVFKAIWYWISRWGCRIFCILSFQFRVYGADNVPKKGAFLLASNHQSYLDPVFCGVFLRRRLNFLARDSLFKNRFFSLLISSLNAIAVKRDAADLSAMRTVIARLKQGEGVCLYPEATRTYDGKIAPFKAGLGLLAKRGRACIVPVLIDGAFESWPRDSKMFSPAGLIVVWYGRPITREQAKTMNDQELAATITDTLRRMQTKCRLRHGKRPYNYP
ncbi:MAG: lysophospholipid acyltransferase family protein [Planctomycetota bacterium]|jgi:1-acyl-sn-glycerol-3-phosphate acyltransferase